MRRLVNEGFLRLRSNYGTLVGTWSAREISEFFALRALLESAIAGAAVCCISPAQIDSLVSLQKKIEAQGAALNPESLTRTAALNRDFHLAIVGASGHPRLVIMLTNTIEAPVVQQTFRRYNAQQLQRSFHHHREPAGGVRAPYQTGCEGSFWMAVIVLLVV